MPTLEKQAAEVERMRALLHELVIAKVGNMVDPEVGKLSGKLDKLIVKYQKTKDKSNKE